MQFLKYTPVYSLRQCKRPLDNLDDDSGTSDEEEALSLDNDKNTTMPLEKEISKVSQMLYPYLSTHTWRVHIAENKNRKINWKVIKLQSYSRKLHK